MYHNRIPKYVKFLVESKTIFEKLMVSSILYQYESGETENSIILAKPSNIKSLLLRHGFSSYYKTTSNLRWRYDTERLLPRHPNTMLLWGKADFDYYSEHIKTTKQEFVITGCPKYDQFFNKNINIKNNDKKKILITPEPLTYGWSGLLDTNSAIKYEIFLNKLIKLLKKIKNVEILVKLHPGWGWTHNNTLITIFHNIDPTIPVYQTKPIQELLEIVDIVINLTPEDNEPSTVMLEALIFKIPVIDISLDDRNNNFEYEADKPMCTLSYKANIEKYINKILFDEIFQTNLIRCSQIILENYLANKGSSSLHVANLLCSL